MEGLRTPGVPQAHAPSAGAHKRDPVVAAVGIAALATAAAVAAASRTAVDESRLREAIEAAAAPKHKKSHARKIAARCGESKEHRPKKSSKASSERSSSARVKSKPRKAEAAAQRGAKAQAQAQTQTQTQARAEKGDSARAARSALGAKKGRKTSESAPPAARHAASAFKLSAGDLPHALRPDHASRTPSHVRGTSALRVDLSSASRRPAVSQRTSFTVVPSGGPATVKTPTSAARQKSLGKKASTLAVPTICTAPTSRATSPILAVASHLSTSNVKSAPFAAAHRRLVSASTRHATGKAAREEPSSATAVRSPPPAEKASAAGTRSAKSKAGVHKAASALSTATSPSHPRLLFGAAAAAAAAAGAGAAPGAKGAPPPKGAVKSAPQAHSRAAARAQNTRRRSPLNARRRTPSDTRRRTPSGTRSGSALDKGPLEALASKGAACLAGLLHEDLAGRLCPNRHASLTVMRQELARERLLAKHLAPQDEEQAAAAAAAAAGAAAGAGPGAGLEAQGTQRTLELLPEAEEQAECADSFRAPAPALAPAALRAAALDEPSPSVVALRDAIFHSDEPFLADHPRSLSPSRARVRAAERRSRSRASTESAAAAPAAPAGVYHLKRVAFGNRRVPIVMQNANGPCPLIAVANTLLLRGRVLISDMVVVVSAAQLVEYVSDAVADTVANVVGEGDANSDRALDARANAVQNAHDAIAVLPELQHGLDVNVRFGGVSDFEPTRECAVFDVLRIPLYHGWLVDPQCEAAARAVGRMGYNELVEHILANKSSADQRLAASALQAEEFLASTAAQLTYHGLCELAQAAREGEVAVFFRNNHFSTLYKHKAALYLLVTDQGFLHEPSVVWETLNSIDGESAFVDGDFQPASVAGGGSGGAGGAAFLSVDEVSARRDQIASDEALARAFAEEERREAARAREALRAAQAHAHPHPHPHAPQQRSIRPDTCPGHAFVPPPAPAPAFALSRDSSGASGSAPSSAASSRGSAAPAPYGRTPSSVGAPVPRGPRGPARAQ